MTFYVKLTRGFKVRTPIGHYNLDWAIVMEERDEHEQVSETLYLVRETKRTLEFGDLRPEEFRKLKYSSCHFNGALGVSYKVVVGADHLPHGGKEDVAWRACCRARRGISVSGHYIRDGSER